MSAMDSFNAEKFEIVPPDGGWGYAIAIAAIINISTTTMFLSSSSLLFKEFLQETGICTTNATLMRGVSAITSAIAGYITSPLLKILSLRMLALLAILIFNAGGICILFVKSVFAFHICQGILQGLGIGFIYNLSCTIINEYFVKKRLMAISLVQSVVAAITMVAPLVLKWSLDEFGFRGTILLISGVSIHNFIAVALMQPVKWHMKRVVFANGSNEKLLQDKKFNEEAAVLPTIKIMKASNLSETGEKICASSENDENDKIKKVIHLLVDKSLSQTFVMSCVCAGPALAMFADSTYSAILPQALHNTGWDKDHVALALILYGTGDIAMRVLFIFLSNWLQKLGSQELYIVGVAVGLVSRLGMLWSKSVIATMVYISLVGASHCAICILIPLVVADAVAPEQFTTALGLLMMITGLVNLVLKSAIGAVRELSESNGPAFYLIASCFAIIVLFWSIELCYKSNIHKRNQRKEYLQQKKINK